MNSKLAVLAERRAELTARAAAQRVELAQRLEPWCGALAVVDQGVAAVRYFKRHPELMAVLATFAVVIRPRRIAILFKRGWVVWRMAHFIRRRLTES
ncbi:MAG: YqjK-like family protein [Betaproteobacteria bacterium]